MRFLALFPGTLLWPSGDVYWWGWMEVGIWDQLMIGDSVCHIGWWVGRSTGWGFNGDREDRTDSA